MNGLYSVIRLLIVPVRGGGWLGGVSRALTPAGMFPEGGKPLGGPKISVKGGPHNFYVGSKIC